jgi:hypothetical protein
MARFTSKLNSVRVAAQLPRWFTEIEAKIISRRYRATLDLKIP